MRKSIILLFLISFFVFEAQSAVRTVHTNRALFEAELLPVGILTDDYSPASGYPAGWGIYNNATMNGFFGETEYFTTGFSNWNIIQSGENYCAGCNGSYRLNFQNTSVSIGGVGVFGAGIDILFNQSSLPYHAFVTYGDGTTEDIPLPVGASFFGLTSFDLIESIHFGLINGGTTKSGSFGQDNLTIGPSLAPNVPTMGQWALIILALAMVNLGVITLFQYRKKTVLV